MAALAARAMAGLLYGVDPRDFGGLALASGLLLLAALPGALLPARRAAAVLPVQALRAEQARGSGAQSRRSREPSWASSHSLAGRPPP